MDIKDKDMVAIIKQGSTKESINKLLKRVLSRKESKGIDAYKYCGVIKLKEDAMTIQERLRDEW